MIRKIKFFFQRLTRGWDDSDTWSLDYTIAQFVLPRLKRFKELNIGAPSDLTEETWDEILDKMIKAMENTIKQWDEDLTEEETEKMWEETEEGHKLFGEYFSGLWW